MSAVFDLQAVPRPSQVLGAWLAGREGGLQRAGLQVPAVSNLTAVSSDLEAMRAIFAPINSASGYPVTDHTAMLVGTVYSCLAKKGGAVLQLPLHEYRRTATGERERAPLSDLWWMLNEAPLPGGAWTAASWKDWIVRCVALRGDQHTEILRGTGRRMGEIIGLKPHHPDYSKARRIPGGITYDVMDQDTGRVYGVSSDDMLHFTGFGFNGCHSISAIQQAARNAIGNALAAADFTGRNLGEGAMPQIALSYPNKLNPDQAALLRESFVATYSSAKPGARKLPLIMTEGGTAAPLSISPVDMDLLASRKLEKQDICDVLEVPPIILGDSEKASAWGTGIEQITLGWVRFAIKPALCRWEEELNRKLFRRAGRFVEFELDGLLRGDSKAQSEAFRAALGGPGTGNGWMSVAEIRKLKNLPPAGGDSDKLYKADTKADTKAPTPAPAPGPTNPE